MLTECLSHLTSLDDGIREFTGVYNKFGDTRWRSSLRHYATSRKVAGLSTDEVDFFKLLNPSSRIMALGSTQPVTEMSTRNLPGG
jgi:hypothetical protein